MRMTTFTLVSTMALTTVNAQAREGGLMDAASLGAICRESREASLTYVMGVVEQAYISKSAKFCIQKGYTMMQARDTVCRYIHEEAPEEVLPLSAAVITNEVLGNSWPCQ